MNKPKIVPTAPAENAAAKRGRGRPRGSKNKPKIVPVVAGPSQIRSPPAEPSSDKAKTGAPGFEFFVFVGEDTLERLKLREKFVTAIAGQESDHAFLREAGKGQRVWRLDVHFDGEGRMFFTGHWKEFVLAYNIERGFFLTFRHHQGTLKFTIRIFDGSMCCLHFHPVEE
jgi:hypothetical protein